MKTRTANFVLTFVLIASAAAAQTVPIDRDDIMADLAARRASRWSRSRPRIEPIDVRTPPTDAAPEHACRAAGSTKPLQGRRSLRPGRRPA